MPAKGESLEVARDLAAEVISDPLGTVGPQITLPEMEETLEHGEPDNEGDKPGDEAHGVLASSTMGGDTMGSHTHFDPTVDDLANQMGYREFHGRNHKKTEIGSQRGKPVLAKVAQDSKSCAHG